MVGQEQLREVVIGSSRAGHTPHLPDSEDFNLF